MLDPHQRSLRVGLAALACALVFRLFSLGLPEKLVAWLAQPDTAAFLFYLETGRNVRFSTSEAVFSPDFLESPPAQTPIPTFSGEEEVDLTYSTVKDAFAYLYNCGQVDLEGNLLVGVSEGVQEAVEEATSEAESIAESELDAAEEGAESAESAPAESEASSAPESAADSAASSSAAE